VRSREIPQRIVSRRSSLPILPPDLLPPGPLKLYVTIILDGAGVGDAPDAEAYGDAGSDTLGHVVRQQRPSLPNLTRWGLGRLVDGLPEAEAPAAAWGRMTERAAGKDSTTGHWALAGLVLEQPFPTYPDGFPDGVIDAFCERAGVDGVLGNKPASGTAIIAELGAEHERTGRPIVYTSADSVFQIAAHVDVIPLDEQYRLCQVARDEVMVGEHAVGRVIARPFSGEAGAYERISAKRKDFSLLPSGPTLLDQLQGAGVRTVCVGKVASLFGGQGVDEEIKTAGNDDGVEKTLAAIREAAASGAPTFVWTNLVDFDELYGHRSDAEGYARALEAFDAALPELEAALPDGAVLTLTADHGNDPTYPGSDHTRERVPVLRFVKGDAGGGDLGTHPTFAAHAADVAALLGVAWDGPGAPLAG
jgi:phosphopentomutase